MITAVPLVSSITPFSELPRLVRLPSGDREYEVALPKTAHVILYFGQKLYAPAASFIHPNLLARVAVFHEIKRGDRSWHRSPGVDLYFAIPAEQIALVPVPGYSYVQVQVAGVDLCLNVCGGTHSRDGQFGWQDRVTAVTECCLGHSVRDLTAIAAVATPLEALKAAGWRITSKPLDAADALAIEQARIELNTRRALREGMVAVLSESVEPPYAGRSGKVLTVEPGRSRIVIDLGSDVGRTVAASAVDWAKTAVANSLPAGEECQIGVTFDAPLAA